MVDGRTSGPTSASSSSFSGVSYPTGSHRHPSGTPDPASAISSVYSEHGAPTGESDGVGHILTDLAKLSLEIGRPLDVEDLDDDGWRAASETKKIIELGSLGEGAGGAVTRCRLEGGKTEFALKVGAIGFFAQDCMLIQYPDHNHRPKSRCQEADQARISLQQGMRFRAHMQILWRF